jgi:hypothetical protein
VAWLRAALALIAAGTAAAVLLSGGSSADPRTPSGLPGLPPPFLGTVVVGSGRLTAAIDSYGDVVDLRPAPAGSALIDNPTARQVAGSVSPATGIVPWVSLDGRAARPLWTADSVRQRYRPGTNVAVTEARFGAAWVRIAFAAGDTALACLTAASDGVRVSLRSKEPAAARKLRCHDRTARRIVAGAEQADRRWLAQARPLANDAPAWAQRMYRRSLLVLRALTGRRSGAVAAGARDGWAYVWPRDAGAVALAFAASGYRAEARRIARFLLGLDLDAAARFHGNGTSVSGRAAQGDAGGWVDVAARATGLPVPRALPLWQDRADYWEGDRGDYLANAIAAGATLGPFEYKGTLVRQGHDPRSGQDSAAAWAVRPFPQPALFSAVGRTLLDLSRRGPRFGITPGAGWPETDPWTAPTAWSAWSLAALSKLGGAATARYRGQALRLMTALRRAAADASTLPERVDLRSGLPHSTTPLAWTHAFALLTLKELWPM